MTSTRSIWIKSLVAGGAALAGTWYYAGLEATLSVGAGILIATVNFWLLERLVKGLLGREKAGTRRLIGIFLIKACILFGLIGYVVMNVPIVAGPFLLGLSCVVLGIVLEGVIGIFRTPEVEN